MITVDRKAKLAVQWSADIAAAAAKLASWASR
jgi:hypothetical protein